MLVRRLDPIILTANDLPTMQVDPSLARRVGGFANEPPTVDGFLHHWDGTQPQEHISVRYCLFRNVADAKKAAKQWQRFIGAEAFYEPEPNAEDVIGDATWRIPNKDSIWFVKNNVLVHVQARRPKINQLALTRSVARKIESKINAVLRKKIAKSNTLTREGSRRQHSRPATFFSKRCKTPQTDVQEIPVHLRNRTPVPRN